MYGQAVFAARERPQEMGACTVHRDEIMGPLSVWERKKSTINLMPRRVPVFAVNTERERVSGRDVISTKARGIYIWKRFGMYMSCYLLPRVLSLALRPPPPPLEGFSLPR